MKSDSEATTFEPLFCLFFNIGTAFQSLARSRVRWLP
jgi:hypothetical protein